MLTCIKCHWATPEAAVRGKIFYRCRNPEGRLLDPMTGEPGTRTYGRVVDRPLNDGADHLAANVVPPEWCPMRP